MNKLLEELMAELKPSFPIDEAVTTRMMVDASNGELNKDSAQAILMKKVKNEGWKREWHRGKYYYWKE